MYLGPFRLAADVSGIVISRLATLAPEDADSPPTYRVYSGTTLLTTGTTVAFDDNVLNGAYRFAFAATQALGFARGGKYDLIATWQVSGVGRTEHFTFTIT